MVSDWPAGQSSALAWSPDCASLGPDGLCLRLGAAPPGSPRPCLGGEVQSCDTAAAGTWAWTAQAPAMREGAVFGLFAFRADWQRDPWLEFDMEFVGADTRRVRLNVHMEDAAGTRVSLEEARGTVVAELGFDAAGSVHRYEIEVTERAATFRADGRVLGRVTAADMPGRLWRTGEMRGFANLWCVDAGLEPWAGRWDPGGPPLVARIEAIEMRPHASRLSRRLLGRLRDAVAAAASPRRPPQGHHRRTVQP
jgi:serralysin